MPVRLNGSTSGYTELSAPAVAGNNSISFPNTSGIAVVNGANSAIVSATAQNTTSGTSIDFTGIPSWAKRVTVMFNGVSTSGTSFLITRLGAGSVQTTGYITSLWAVQNGAANAVAGSTSEFTLPGATAAELRYGTLQFSLLSGNTWIGTGNIITSGGFVSMLGGNVVLTGTLDRVRITTVNGTDTFDGGSINIMYE
jgi:hypothetical protein